MKLKFYILCPNNLQNCKSKIKVFSSGHNLKEMTVETGYDYHKKIFDTCEAMMRLVGQVNSL